MGNLCGGPSKDKAQNLDDPNTDAPASSTKPKKETAPAKPKISDEETLERERQAAEKARQEKARKDELDKKFTALCTEFVELLSTNVKGEVSLDELKTVYGDNAPKLMEIADKDGDKRLSVEETKTLFLTNKEPDCELVMQAIERISMVKEIREKRKAKAEKEAKRKEFEDACGDFVDTLRDDLGDTITEAELKLVRQKPYEKYAGVLYEADVRTVAGVMDAFTEGEEMDITEVTELSECFKEIKKIRKSEAEFDTALDEFFGDLDGLDIAALGEYMAGLTQDIFSKLDANNDGKIDKAEMKPMFRLEKGYYDKDRLEKVKSGVDTAIHEQHVAKLAKAKEEFLEEVRSFKGDCGRTSSPIRIDELKEIMPENADKYIKLCSVDASDDAFLKIFKDGDSFDKPGLLVLKGAVEQVLENRLKQFETRLGEFRGKMVESWLAKLKVDKLTEECPDHANNYQVIASGEKLDADALKAMFVIDGVPQFKAFNVIYDALTTIENKAMKKFDKNMKELVDFIGQYCTEESMGKFKRQDVFQVYIDETRVGEFDKRWVKKMLNKPIDDLPNKPELRQLFTNKKTKEPDPQLVKGFLSALKTITDRRRLSIKQNKLLAEADYEKELLRLVDIVDNQIKTQENREILLTETGNEHTATLIAQLQAAHNGMLKLEEIKPLWMENGVGDTPTVTDFINDIISRIEAKGGEVKDDDDKEEEVEAAESSDKRGPDKNEMVERPTASDVFEAAEKDANAETAEEKAEEIANQTDKEVVQEAEEFEKQAEEAVEAEEPAKREPEAVPAQQEEEVAAKEPEKSDEPEAANEEEVAAKEPEKSDEKDAVDDSSFDEFSGSHPKDDLEEFEEKSAPKKETKQDADPKPNEPAALPNNKDPVTEFDEE